MKSIPKFSYYYLLTFSFQYGIIISSRGDKEDKTMTREEMLTAVISKRGFEHQDTIWFAKQLETVTDEAEIQAAFDVAINDFEDWELMELV